MLPLRIELEGFLTYRQKATLDFRGHWLWAITGANGAGKSAIFDAITFVLFGEHRGGRQREELLISQGADYSRVAFDFGVGSSAYRVERTLTRRRGRRGQLTGLEKTYQVYSLDPSTPELAAGQPLPDTNSRDGLEKWVCETIGLSNKTFASSVLLRQGEADKFVTAPPAERKGVLMDVLDLQPYLRLEAAARRHATDWRSRAETTGHAFQALAHATQDALEQATERLRSAQEAAAKAEADVRATDGTLANARRFADLTHKIRTARQQLEPLKAILIDASVIEVAQQELTELNDVLPKLHAIYQHRRAAEAARNRASDSRRLAEAVDVSAAEVAHRESADVSKRAGKEYEGARAVLTEARGEEERLRPFVEMATTIARLRGEASDFETTAAQLERETVGLEQAREYYRACGLAARSIAGLQALANDRREAAAEDDRTRQIVERLGELEAEVAQKTQYVQAAQQALSAATAAIRELEIALAGRQTAHDSVNAELANRQAAGNEGTCSRCGQAVDAVHIQREIDDCVKRRGTFVEEIDGLKAQLGRERAEAERAGSALKRAENNQAVAEAALSDARRKAQEHGERRDRASVRAAQHLAALPEPYRGLAGETKYPDEVALAHVAALAGGLAEAETTWRSLDQKASRAAALREQAAHAHDLLTQANDRFPGVDLAEAQTSHEAARAKVTSLATAERDAFARWQAAQAAATAADQETKACLAEHNRLTKEAGKQDASANADERAAQALQAQVTAAWQERAAKVDLGCITAAQARQREIAPVAAKGQALTKAREECPRIEGELTAHEDALSAIPDADRIAVASAEVHLVAMQTARKRASVARDQAVAAETTLKGEFQRRQELERIHQREQGLAHDYGLLTKYLGKDHLQAWLVQGAQEAIGQAANIYLAAISDGLLRLNLQPKDDDLEILVSDLSSGQEPMEVKFVSGSQRFRVAVALALAIGQYSGGASRQIKSVIIDEGFGSLDADGRRQMIEQLKALEGTLDRVILVSHHEAFHDAFANGYHIEKTDGTSRATLRHDMETRVVTE